MARAWNIQTALLVFARVPLPGKVMTRLIGELGEERACELHIQLVERTIAQCQDLGWAGLQLWLDRKWSGNECCQRWHTTWPRMAFRVQCQGDLGERMSSAFERVLVGYRNAILVGSDCPGMEEADLREAQEALTRPDTAVLGSSMDGGYYLIGLPKPMPQLFIDMPWGTSEVADLTRQRLLRMGLAIHELPEHRDIDRPADLRFLPESIASRFPLAPASTP
ncbi:MAG: TIGR04282 family arsenosugar biosynthesis glycosyltransferase [Candidatus Eutrophobiaceae bacterium]